MYWHTGPWIWDAEKPCWKSPEGCIGAIDLRSIPQQAATETQAGSAIFLTDRQLSSDYELLGVGDWRDVKTSQRLKNRIPKRASTRQPKGDDLLSHILDAICDGSDPTGDDFAKPLMPDGGMSLQLAIGPFSYQWKTAPWNYHWDKIQDVERASLQTAFDDATAGKLKDREQHRRILDAMCEKYNLAGVDDWKSLVPAKLRKSIPGRLKHETTYTDNFNRSDSTTVGSSSEGWSWTETEGTEWAILSNALSLNTASERTIRAEADLSSSDHYAETTWTNVSGISYPAICTRFATSALTFYMADFRNTGTLARIYKRVSGTYTVIASGAFTSASPSLLKCQSNGSAIKGYSAGVEVVSVTDTAISSGTRCGIDAAGNLKFDDWTHSDIAANTVSFTRLERGLRGVTRGVYTQNMG